jgi:biopolymer transport protein TolR
MSVSGEPQGKGSKRPLNADLNLVPYIDLLTCMVAFLLITAVWTQVAQLHTKPRGPGGTDEPSPPAAKLSLVVGQDNVNVLLNQERAIVPNQQGEPDWEALSALLKKAKGQYPDLDDAQIASADDVLFERLAGVMDVTIAAGFFGVSLEPSAMGGL